MNVQLMIDQLEARSKEIDYEIGALSRSMDELTAKGKALSEKLNEKVELRNYHTHAINNLKSIEAGVEPLIQLKDLREQTDPWGDAG